MSHLPFNLRDRESLGRKLVNATLGSAGVRIVGMAVTFLVGVQLARYLGPEDYGVYSTVMAIVALLIVPAQLGLPQLVTREVSASMARRDFARVKGAVIWFAISIAAASVIMVIAGLAGYDIWNGSPGKPAARAFHWGLTIIPLFALTNVAASTLRGFHLIVRAQAFESLLRPAIFAVFLFLAAAGLGAISPIDALILQAASAMIVLPICAISLYRILPAPVLSAVPTVFPKEWATSAAPMTGTEILRVTDGQYGVLLLGLMLPVEDVGLFRMALATVAFVGLPSTIINLVIMPYVAQIHAEEQPDRMQRLATGSAVAMFASTLLMTFAIYILGESLIVFVFGEAFAPAWPALVIMGLAYTVNAFFGSSAAILNMSGGERTVTLAFALGLGLALPLAWLLVYQYGIVGVALAMLASEALRGIIMWRRVVRMHGVDAALTSIIGFQITGKQQKTGASISND